MFSLICSKCAAELQVPNSLAGCLIRCHECEGVTRAPRPADEDDDEAIGDTYQVQTTQDSPGRAREIQNFVKSVEETARREAERKPYRKKEQFPVDLIAGILLTGTGGLMLLRTLGDMVFGGMSISLFTFGILLPIGLILFGAMCLKCWMSE